MTVSPQDFGQAIFRLSPDIALEIFEDGALLLQLTDRSLIEMNAVAGSVLAATDGKRTVAEVAAELAAIYEVPGNELFTDVQVLYEQLAEQKIIEPVLAAGGADKEYTVDETTTSARYMRNPDVTLREEDEDGGLLFNPDTNQIQVVNTTALHIWKACDGTRTIPELVQALLEDFEGAPADEIHQDTQEFIDAMVASGFIGTAETIREG